MFAEKLYCIVGSLIRQFYLFTLGQAIERAKYDQIFDGLKPINGLLPGDKVKPVGDLNLFCSSFFL